MQFFAMDGQGEANGIRSPNNPGSGHQSAVLESFEDRIKRMELDMASKKLGPDPVIVTEKPDTGMDKFLSFQESKQSFLLKWLK